MSFDEILDVTAEDFLSQCDTWYAINTPYYAGAHV